MATTAEGSVGRAASEGAVRLLEVIKQSTGTALPVRLPDGTEWGLDTAGFRIVLHRPWALRRLLTPPFDLSAGEAYVEGDLDVEGDIVAAMAAGATLDAGALPVRTRMELLRLVLAQPQPPRRRHERRAHLRGRLHSPARDRAAIAFHYDLPHAFYQQFLDRDLVYSCAYFAEGEQPADLEAAQERKLDLICRKLRLQPGQSLLDIGCGWGSLLLHAARYGVTGVGVTLSATQAEVGRQRVAAAGLSERVTIRLQDYREVDGVFDAVASVGMVEHVGPDRLGEYCAAVRRLTAPGGLVLNHAIVTGDAQDVRSNTGRTFAAKYVFPDGGLVPAWQMIREVQAAGFGLSDVEQLGPQYALTLREWIRRLESNHDRAVAVTGEADYRIWRAYMAGSAFNFASGNLGVIQVLATLGHRLPLGRAWMCAGT